MLGCLLGRIDLQWNWDAGGAVPPGFLALLILVVALVGVVMGGAVSERSVGRLRKVPSLSHLDISNPAEKAAQSSRRAERVGSLFAPRSRVDRRTFARRPGNPVPIRVRDEACPAEPVDGGVLDRSRGGLLVALSQPVPVGARLSVRTPNASDDLEWIPVEVRHCRHTDGRWLVGCKFQNELPWSVLLLFG